MIKGLFETHIGVRELERSMRFYEDVIGLKLGMKDEDRCIAFYWIGGWGTTMLGVWEKPEDQLHSQHFAFEIELKHMDASIMGLKANRVPTHNFFGEATDMPSVFGWVPAVSIYFKDPDGHELEYLARLHGPPQPERGIIPWDQWNET